MDISEARRPWHALKIDQAPAELQLPCKEDIQFHPPFKVTVRSIILRRIQRRGHSVRLQQGSAVDVQVTPPADWERRDVKVTACVLKESQSYSFPEVLVHHALPDTFPEVPAIQGIAHDRRAGEVTKIVDWLMGTTEVTAPFSAQVRPSCSITLNA